MAEVTTELIKKVRQLTGAGMSDVKKALVAAAGDVEKAVETLRLKGAKDVGKRSQRTAANGLIAVHLGAPANVLLELNCETDFVAKTETFQELAADFAAHAARSDSDDVAALLDSAFGTGTVASALQDASAAIGEKLELRRFVRFAGEHVSSYMHKTSPDLPPAIGVLVELTGDAPDAGKSIAQHVAAFAPRFRAREDVPADTVEAERRLAEQMARDEGKPEQAIPRIVEGRLTGFYRDFVLLDQASAQDPKKSVRQVLADAGIDIVRFARLRVGEA
ncbi:MAG: translation elongation factor Ts [Frankiaceae bacterium]